MAYIRGGSELPSGARSESYVFGGPEGLVNINKGILIPYQDIRDLFKTKTDLEVKNELEKRLNLTGEELEVVCNRLFDERNNGEWEKPFDFEKGI
ncbi:hypothetical protein J4466_03960 [Candidatus Pacearchaeota archaeon]|nr:hypothetical protein [Candidatus Pacearchaeota archaeon]